MKVIYEDRGSKIHGCVKFDNEEILINGDFKSLADMKNFAVEVFAEEFDKGIKQNLGITYPYTVGNITFYNLSELEKFILGKQKSTS